MAVRRPDITIIGAGVVGLAIADALLAERPELQVLVLEKESTLAAHASGRNSGVIHAGFYYTPDSLKAKLTRQGNELLTAFCDEHQIAVRRCGKVVVAKSADELPALQQLLERGRTNGVPLELVDEQGLQELKPRARTYEQAIWSPSTSVADPQVVVGAIADRVRRRGGEIRLDARVAGAGPGFVQLVDERIDTGHVVNAAGLYADKVAAWFGQADDYVLVPFKGLYWYGNVPDGWLTRLVYPVPDARNPFLGVHLTITADGHTKIGPTAIPAGHREDYSRYPSLHASETVEVMKAYPAFLRSKEQDAGALLRQELPKYSRRHLVNQARALVPSIDLKAFRTPGSPGVRAQLMHKSTGRFEMDFVVRHDADSTHVLNAVSPAWTSSLAFGQLVAGQILG